MEIEEVKECIRQDLISEIEFKGNESLTDREELIVSCMINKMIDIVSAQTIVSGVSINLTKVVK